MLSIRDVTVPEGKEIRSIPLNVRSIHARKYAPSTRAIPAEIISSIMRFAFDSSPNPVSQPVSFSHVSRQWRQTSLSTPSLWSCIVFSHPLSKAQLTRAATWMTRSHNYPLDIYMDFRDPLWDWDETFHAFGSKSMEGVMRILVPQAPRWRSIELLTDTWAPIFTFLSCTVTIDSAPLLQALRLARCNEYFVAQGETFRPTSLALPVAWFGGGAGLYHLRHVSLSGVHIDWTRSGLIDLQELELRYHAREVMPTLAEFRRILCANMTLKRLVILGWGPRTDLTVENGIGQDDLQTINLPQLEELEIGFVDVTYGLHLLSLFSLPELRSLAVEDVLFGIELCARQDYSPLLDRLVGLSTAGHVPLPLLHMLLLRGIHADGASIRRLFGRLCALKSLRLDRLDETTLGDACLALCACDSLEELTLKDVDPAGAPLMFSSYTFPPCLRIFLDVDDMGVDSAEEEAPACLEGL